jgi:uncharacterized iron-regulated protein
MIDHCINKTTTPQEMQKSLTLLKVGPDHYQSRIVAILTSFSLGGLAQERLNVALKANDNVRAACMW